MRPKRGILRGSTRIDFKHQRAMRPRLTRSHPFFDTIPNVQRLSLGEDDADERRVALGWLGLPCPDLPAPKGHCQSKLYTACSRTTAGWSSTVFAHELLPRSAGFDAENRPAAFPQPAPAAGSRDFSTEGQGRSGLGLDDHVAVALAGPRIAFRRSIPLSAR